jgi:hypothetical protein
MKKLLLFAALAAAAAYAIPKLLARSNTQVHRINQER